MGDLVRIETGAGTGSASLNRMSNRKSMGMFSDRDRSAGNGDLIVFDPRKKDLQLLQFRRRRLEGKNLVLYKASTRVEMAGNPGRVEVSVLVKKRLVEYYYFCPRTGRRMGKNIRCRNRLGVDCKSLSWPEIEHMVRDHVLNKPKREIHVDAPGNQDANSDRDYVYSDRRLYVVPTQKGGSTNDSEEDSLLHRLLRKLRTRWSMRG